ncbi:keratocan-like [Chironomus tepperi]|uniref:keratocan-like n=1 Tax=Chironomus tepperi TaxID=113505 RepID=UPI00391F36E3
MKIIVLFINFVTIFKSLICLDIDCSYIIHNYPHVHLISCCHVMNNLNIEFPDKALIKFVSGTDIEKDETTGFRIYNKTTQYFPRGLDSVFKNLKVIEISHGHLKDIRREDLNSFDLLEVLYLYANDIEILEEGIFDNNVNLKFITLSENRIIHIDQNAFSKLHQLTDLYLNKNECIDLQADNLSPLDKVINAAKNMCNNEDYNELHQSLIALESTKISLKLEDFSTFYRNLTNLDILTKAKNFKNSTIRKRIHRLKDWSFQVLWSDVSSFNKFLSRFNVTVLERLDRLERNLLKQELDSREIDDNQAQKIEISKVTSNKLEEEHYSQINDSIPSQNQVQKEETNKSKLLEVFWIGFCCASLLFLMIVLIKRYFFNDHIVSYKVANSNQFDN